MKSNKEIIEYLKPYTEMEGIYFKTKVVIEEKVRGPLYDYMVVYFDIKSSWEGVDGTNTKHQTLKQHITKNGFIYVEYQQCYMRPYYKKYWNK
jgi:hypothetical protein